jgi:hypothetical protein
MTQTASRGKQLPSFLLSNPVDNISGGPTRAKAHLTSDYTMNQGLESHCSPEAAITHLDDSVYNSWRMRDPADLLVREKQMRETYRLNNASTDAKSNTEDMPLSFRYNIERSLEKLASKTDIVQAAFDSAAQVVVRTVVQEGVQMEAEYDDGYDVTSSEGSNNDYEILHLPEQLAHLSVSLANIRLESLHRSHGNKDMTKKLKQYKGSTQSLLATPEAASSSSTVNASVHKNVKTDAITKSHGTLQSASKRQKSKVVAEKSDDSTPRTTSDNATSAATPTIATSAGSASLPKFTRNTPASSAAALDARLQTSRAILCAAGTMVWDSLTPQPSVGSSYSSSVGHGKFSDNDDGEDDEGSDAIPDAAVSSSSSLNARDLPIHLRQSLHNLGAVIVEAQALSTRTTALVETAVQRADWRRIYRQENAKFCTADQEEGGLFYSKIGNPFIMLHQQSQSIPFGPVSKCAMISEGEDSEDEHRTRDDGSNESDVDAEPTKAVTYAPNNNALTDEWNARCLSRLLSILRKGVGHALLYDVQWGTRYGRIASLFRSLCEMDDNWGPHIILTTEPHIEKFAQEFHDMQNHLPLVMTKSNMNVRVMVYRGSNKDRQHMRQYWSDAHGLSTSPFHVLVTQYKVFFEDYLHFCQWPWNTVVVDEGAAWMAASQVDPNSPLGVLWDSGLWSKNDHQIGLAGTTFKEWNFSKTKFTETNVKDAWIGLTARHRIMTSSGMIGKCRQSGDSLPVSGLIDFCLPHFFEIAREEWDRSRISNDAACMAHFRRLLVRSTVAHNPESSMQALDDTAMSALSGELADTSDWMDPLVPAVYSDDYFVGENKVSFSRRSCLQWLGSAETSWLRYEMGSSVFQHILDYMKVSNNHGYFCEEVTTASSLTSSGASGQIAGTLAYRCAVRCNRHFGSEQGLRLHVSSLHAPPGTWLCRTCGMDCITSQARTHHERVCGQPVGGKSMCGSFLCFCRCRLRNDVNERD